MPITRARNKFKIANIVNNLMYNKPTLEFKILVLLITVYPGEDI